MNEVATVERAPITELPDAELMTQLAIAKALSKETKRKFNELKAEAGRRLKTIHDAYGANGFDVKIGNIAVGKVTFYKQKVGKGALGEYDEWAWETNRGTRELVVDVSSHDFPQEIIDEIRQVAEQHGAYCHVKYSAYPVLTGSLSVKDGVVVDKAGEVVPGTYAKEPEVHVTKCEAKDVAEAMRISGDDYLVSGLLEA